MYNVNHKVSLKKGYISIIAMIHEKRQRYGFLMDFTQDLTENFPRKADVISSLRIINKAVFEIEKR